MKNLTESEIREAKILAYRFAYSDQNILLNKRFKYDARTRVGRLAKQIFDSLDIDKKAIRFKRIRRLEGKPKPYTNWLQNPIVLDYLRNTPTRVCSDRLCFGDYRNHWAKDETQFKILSILKNKRR